MTRDQSQEPAVYWEELAPWRRALDRTFQRATLAALRWLTAHWLLAINSVSLVLFLLPAVVAPAFSAWGWHEAANLIFGLYGSTCHQMPSRSFFPFGEQMALCQRMAAIFGSFLAFGTVYILFRRRLKSLPAWLVAAYCLPLAVDGFTQLFGWRESSWELRLATGAFFGLATVWYVFPHLELLMRVLNWKLQHQGESARLPQLG